jgi:hypothetical protein
LKPEVNAMKSPPFYIKYSYNIITITFLKYSRTVIGDTLMEWYAFGSDRILMFLNSFAIVLVIIVTEMFEISIIERGPKNIDRNGLIFY